MRVLTVYKLYPCKYYMSEYVSEALFAKLPVGLIHLQFMLITLHGLKAMSSLLVWVAFLFLFFHCNIVTLVNYIPQR